MNMDNDGEPDVNLAPEKRFGWEDTARLLYSEAVLELQTTMNSGSDTCMLGVAVPVDTENSPRATSSSGYIVPVQQDSLLLEQQSPQTQELDNF